MARKNNQWIVIAVVAIAVIFLFRDNLPFSLGAIYDPVVCKDLGLGINKICVKSSPTAVTTPFSADTFHFDINYGSTVNKMFDFRSSGSDWISRNMEDWQGVRLMFRGFSSTFDMLGRGANRNVQVQGYKVLATAGPVTEGTFYATMEREFMFDYHHAIAQQHIKNQGTVLGFTGGFPSTAVDSWVTDIDGQYCGVRATVPLSSSFEYTANYEFTNIVYPCPDRYVDLGDGRWTVYYDNHPVNEIRTYTSILTLTKINGVDLGSESQISDWITNYDGKEAALKARYEGFMRSFKSPVGTDEQKIDYYRFLWGTWLGTQKPAMENPLAAGVSDIFYVDGKSRWDVQPSFGYIGMWIWDSGMVNQGWMAAISDTPNDQTKEMISDILKMWSTQPIGDSPAWRAELHTPYYYGPHPYNTQPAELYVPVVLQAYTKGIITKDFMCNEMYPALSAQYNYYKNLAGSDLLFYYNGGRDASKLLLGFANSDAETGSSAGLGMMAAGMARIGQICGVNYAQHILDYNTIKTNFQSLWRADRGIYWNKVGGTFKDADTDNIGTTPYGVCMAVIADLVPADRIPIIFNTLEQYYVDGTDVYGDGFGYTSVPTTATFYTPELQWDGPTWNWVDGVVCTQASHLAVSRYGLTEMIPIRDKMDRRQFRMMGGTGMTPYSVEEYNSESGIIGRWGDGSYSDIPYMPDGNAIPVAIFDYDIYQDFDFNLVDCGDSCVPPPPTTCTPSWTCTAWSSCLLNQQTRVCTDSNNCGTLDGRPAQTQSCTTTCHQYDAECDGLDSDDVNLKITQWRSGQFGLLDLFRLIREWKG